MLEKLDIDPQSLGPQLSRDHWKSAKAVLAARFKTRTRDEWAALLEASDACVSPVLGLHEAHRHPHMKARGTFVEIDGIVQAAPAPRFSRTVPGTPTPPAAITPENTDRCLSDWFAPSRIETLREQGLID